MVLLGVILLRISAPADLAARFFRMPERGSLQEMTCASMCRLIRRCRYLLFTVACGLFCSAPAAAGGLLTADAISSPEMAWSQSASLALAYESSLGHDSLMQSSGYAWRGGGAAQPDWKGIRRDTAYFLGYQFAAVAVLYYGPESLSGWDREAKQNYSFSRWADNVGTPVWDRDDWWVNYILHPYWGATYYLRARERGLDRRQSFWYSALLSALYEYGAEALFEPVSIQDLVVTPVVGSLVGEYLFTPLRERIRSKPGKLDWADKTLLFITDPLGVLNSGMDRLLGVGTTLRLQPVGLAMPARASGISNAAANQPGHYRSVSPAWGLQFRVDW